jgi:hypothetical protein
MQIAGWAGLLAAVTLGAAVYVPALILTGSLDGSDFILLREITNLLPDRINRLSMRLVDLMEATSLRSRQFFRTRVDG